MATESQAPTSAKRGVIWAFPLMLALSFALNWPYLGSGFLADEIVIIEAMEREPLPYSRWRGAWSGEDMTDLSWFGSPWWAEPDAMGSFFRPLPSLTMEGSLRLFGKVAFPLHLMAVVTHGLIAFLLVLVLVPLVGSRAPPVLAGVLWLACEDHSMTVGFISFATDIMCVFFVCLAMLAHVAWLRKRRPALFLGALLAVVAALGCKETGVVAPLALVVTSFFFPEGRPDVWHVSTLWIRQRADAFLKDPMAWVPWVGIFVLFLALYAGLGLGGMDNLSYNDPVAHPGRYLNHLVVHLPVMWLAAVTVVPPGMGFLDPTTFVPMAIAGVVVFALFLWVLGSRVLRPVVAWGFVLYTLALLPQLGTDAGERLMYLPFLFLAVAVAMPILDIEIFARRLEPEEPPASRLRRVAGWYFLGGVAVAGTVMSAFLPFEYIRWARPAIEDPVTALEHIEPQHETAVILTTRDFFGMLMVPTIVRQEVGRELDIRLLSASAGRATVERLDDASFILRLDRPGWLSSFLPAAFRTDPEVEQGRVYPGDLYDVTVLELTDDGTDVLGVRVDMHVPLNDAETVFLHWDGRVYRPIDLGELSAGESHPLRIAR